VDENEVKSMQNKLADAWEEVTSDYNSLGRRTFVQAAKEGVEGVIRGAKGASDDISQAASSSAGESIAKSATDSKPAGLSHDSSTPNLANSDPDLQIPKPETDNTPIPTQASKSLIQKFKVVGKWIAAASVIYFILFGVLSYFKIRQYYPKYGRIDGIPTESFDADVSFG
jgi:hypothetical protein